MGDNNKLRFVDAVLSGADFSSMFHNRVVNANGYLLRCYGDGLQKQHFASAHLPRFRSTIIVIRQRMRRRMQRKYSEI